MLWFVCTNGMNAFDGHSRMACEYVCIIYTENNANAVHFVRMFLKFIGKTMFNILRIFMAFANTPVFVAIFGCICHLIFHFFIFLKYV